MANGAPFDPAALTVASWNFPLGSLVCVTHGERGSRRTITDRGPARRLRRRGLVLDLSEAAFARLAPSVEVSSL
jgi:rare lipoprotein A (peptidoglycan hydrolase)